MRTTLLLLGACTTLSGCAYHKFMQPGHGESFNAMMAIQADLGRPTVANAAYPLTGFEGLELRQRVTEQSTDEESGNPEAVDQITVE
ncbi:MAG: hypothetical protein GXP62_07130 [Oligoflexia bacterium]|nr:hypothetical protein [Oligoflexia bacterium]